MSLKYAIIGCGRISPNHIAAAIENNLDIVALCDVEESKMDTTIQNFNLPSETKKYLNYKEMLQNEKPELVAICTESGKHGQDCSRLYRFLSKSYDRKTNRTLIRRSRFNNRES